MSVRPTTLAAIVFAVFLVVACTSPDSGASSGSPSAKGSAASVPAAGELPPGCEPIDLRSSSGERIVLDGLWVDDAETPPIRWLLRTQGTCVWGAGQVDGVPFEDTFAIDEVQAMRGSIREDFTIDGEIVLLGHETSFLVPPVWAEVRFVIGADDAELTLREDRERGVPGPRCIDPAQSCLRPLVLVKVGD